MLCQNRSCRSLNAGAPSSRVSDAVKSAGRSEKESSMDDLGESEGRARNIKTLENKADTVTHQTIQLLHQTFIGVCFSAVGVHQIQAFIGNTPGIVGMLGTMVVDRFAIICR